MCKLSDHNGAALSCLPHLLVCNTVRFSDRFLHNTRLFAKYISCLDRTFFVSVNRSVSVD